MDALPSLAGLSLGAGTSKDDALLSFAELDALDADETAAPPGYNEYALYRAEDNFELEKSYDHWQKGKPKDGEWLSEAKKWEYRWYGDPKELLTDEKYPWNPRQVETQGYFDWAPSFWYNFKLVREQESLFAKANLCYSDGTETGKETFMHPASSIFEVIKKQLDLTTWQGMIRDGAWIVDFANMGTPVARSKMFWEKAYREAERPQGNGRGVVIAVVKPGTLVPWFFHKRFADENPKRKDGKDGKNGEKAEPADPAERWLPDPRPSGQRPKDEGYNRIYNLLDPLASHPSHIFLVVLETWPEEGYTKTTVTGPYGDREVKDCAFYKPDKYTEPQLQERGQEGHGWPLNDESKVEQGPVDRPEEVRRAKKMPEYRRGIPPKPPYYFPLDADDSTVRPGDLKKQERQVSKMESATTGLAHGFCEYDDVVCIMLRLWLKRVRAREKGEPMPLLDHVLNERRQEVGANRSEGVVTGDKRMVDLCQSQAMRKLHNEFFKFNDVFRLRVYRKTNACDAEQREETDEDRQYDLVVGSDVDNSAMRDAKDAEIDTIKQADRDWTRHKLAAKEVMLTTKSQLKDARAAQAEMKPRFLRNEVSVKEWQALEQKVAEQTRMYEEALQFFLTYYKRTLQEWYEEDKKWPLRRRYGPQDVLAVQNSKIREPLSLYGRDLPKVRLWSKDANEYMHDTRNVFWEDYLTWYVETKYPTPVAGQSNPPPEIPEFLARWKELENGMMEIKRVQHKKNAERDS